MSARELVSFDQRSGVTTPANSLSTAHMMYRRCPAPTIADRTSVPGSFANAPRVQPFCVPWTATVDSYGIAYSAGLVGVTSSVGYAGTGSYEARMDAHIAANCTAVPGVLPAGYTPRLEHDCDMLSVPSVFSGAAPGICSCWDATPTRYMGPAGPINYYWIPYSAANQRGYTKVSFAGSFTVIDYDSVVEPIAAWMRTGLEDSARGWRNMRWMWNTPLLYSAPPHNMNLMGTVDLYISHNADGSTVANGSHFGDTIDYSKSFGQADLTWNPYISPSIGDYITPEWDTGQMLPALGVPTNYRITVLHTQTADPGPPVTYGDFLSAGTFSAKMSPVVNIPLRWTCCGDSGLIAPGGLV